MQTRTISTFPVVLMGVAYWQPLLDFLKGTLARNGTIDPQDVDLLTPTDSVDLMVREVVRSMAANAPQWARAPRRSRLLREA